MKLDFKGIENTTSKIQNLILLLEKSNTSHLWQYMGLKVEIDATIDYTNQNILIRWNDIEEGFNDKIIVHSLRQFNYHFKLIHP